RAKLLRPMMEAALEARAFTTEELEGMHPEARALHDQIRAERAAASAGTPVVELQPDPGQEQEGRVSEDGSFRGAKKPGGRDPDDPAIARENAEAKLKLELERIRQGQA